ncbi:MAG: flagellar biosynthetic protein FliO [Leptospiraceae bacterium]|nr:flagellar biosynthetic protein FliO [Leptospiraceae bacterium]
MLLILPGYLIPLNAKPAATGKKPVESKPEQAEPGPETQNLREIEDSWIGVIQGKPEQTDPRAANPASERRSPDSANDANAATRLANPGNRQNAAEQRSVLFPEQEGPTFLSVVLRFIGMMALLLGALYLAMRFARKRGGRLFASDESGLVQVLLSVPVVQGKFIQIVDIAGQLMVLGVSDAGVQMISEIRDKETRDRIRLWQSQSTGTDAPTGLLDHFQQYLRKLDLNFLPTRSAKTDAPRFASTLAQILHPDSRAGRTPAAEGRQATSSTSANSGPTGNSNPAAQTELFDDQATVEQISAMLDRHSQRIRKKTG